MRKSKTCLLVTMEDLSYLPELQTMS